MPNRSQRHKHFIGISKTVTTPALVHAPQMIADTGFRSRNRTGYLVFAQSKRRKFTHRVSVRTVSTRKRVADERNDGFRMSSIVGEEGIVVN